MFLLLRSGAFQTKEDLEPMSAFKWGRLYQLAVMHNIVPFVYDGIIRNKSQFFLHLTEKQKKDWEKAIADYREKEKKQNDEEEDEFLRPDRLTNPLLNKRLQDILDDEHSDVTNRQMLMILIRVVRHLFNEGMPIRQLTELGIFLRKNREVDRTSATHADDTTHGRVSHSIVRIYRRRDSLPEKPEGEAD